MIRALIISLALLIALPLHAQEDDRGRLVQLIEGALSDGAARQVRIEGFQGALSSTATLDLLTISDADGVWLTIEDAELTWTRSALLRGALEVDRLAAARIVLDRLPMGEPDPTAPETTPFQLPELPGSIALTDLAIDRIGLGAPLWWLTEQALNLLLAIAHGVAAILDDDRLVIVAAHIGQRFGQDTRLGQPFQTAAGFMLLPMGQIVLMGLIVVIVFAHPRVPSVSINQTVISFRRM